MIFSFTILAADNSTQFVCNRDAGDQLVTWIAPDPTSSDKSELIGFGDEYELKWEFASDQNTGNVAIKLQMNDRNPKNQKTIAVVGSATSYKWKPSPDFKDAVTGEAVTLQNSGGYYLILHDNNTATSNVGNCIGAFQDSSSKPITFFTPGGSGGDGSVRSSSFSLVWSAYLLFLLIQ
eukprot:NODE_37_length_35953_cov_1.028037.p8 type:complete len:178 gc:universal NODE_37_length_35953_cov_1.028037:3437-2904(-)